MKHQASSETKWPSNEEENEFINVLKNRTVKINVDSLRYAAIVQNIKGFIFIFGN